MQRSSLNPILVISASIIFLNSSARASEVSPETRGLSSTLGVSLEAGALGNSGMGLQDRAMTAISIEALPGFRPNRNLLLGVDFNYRFQQQQTKLDNAGNTNLAGKGWLLGFGANYRWNEKWATQAAVDFLGRYGFDKQTSAGQDDHLVSPIGLRAKVQYFVTPWLTLDGSISGIAWRKFHVGGVDRSESSSQWMIGVGATYHFGSINAASEPPLVLSKPVPIPFVQSPVAPPTPSQVEQLSKILPTEKTEKGVRIKLQGTGFEPSKTTMSSELSDQVAAVAAILVRDANTKIVVKGYTDTSGSPAQNKKLSAGRAETVKKALVKGGIEPSRISTRGLGSENPIADNSTAEGRTQNRRVEIETED